MLYLSTLFIIGGIEKEKHTVSNAVLLFGLIIETIYIIYLYVLGISIYKYVIYLFLMLVLVLINTLILRKKGKQNYTIEILTLCFYFVMFAMEETVIITIIATLLIISIKQMIISCKKDEHSIIQNNDDKKIPIGFYLCFTNVIIIIFQNYFLI